MINSLHGASPGNRQGSLPSSLDSTVTSSNNFTITDGKRVVPVKHSTLKIIKTGNHYEIHKASLPYILDRKPQQPITHKNNQLIQKEKNNKRTEEYRKRTTKRAKDSIRRLAKGNFNPNYTKHLILTFDDNKCIDFDNTNISDCNKIFSKFAKKLRKIDQYFMYIKTSEFQKRGVVHFHVMTDLTYIDQKELQNMWGYGIVNINKTPDDIAGYLSKYISKNVSDQRFIGKRTWSHSKNMQITQKIYGKTARLILDSLENTANKSYYTYEYTSEYNGTIKASEYLVTAPITIK